MIAINDWKRTRPLKHFGDDVVRIGSKVSIRHLDTGELDIYMIVLPGDADISRSQVSIFSPMGRAIEFRRVGELVEFDAPAGRVRIRIEAVEAPPLIKREIA